MAERQTRQIEDVRGSGIYPATGPLPRGNAMVRSPAALGHPEARRSFRTARQSIETAAFLTGRAIVGGYFLYNGINHLVNRRMLTEYARAKGVPAPGLGVVASGLLIIGGGLSVLTGAWPKIGAGMITSFLLGVSPQMHAFWREADPQQRMNEMIHFSKNMALVGAGLAMAGHPEPWPWAVRRRYGHMMASTN
jgi:putative oxidoreductase